MSKKLIVIDCQYDFIDGALACGHAEDAVKNIIAYINANPDMPVFYSSDWHNLGHCSFKVNNKGGTWPVHCVARTRGAELHKFFSSKILNLKQRPDKHKNIYYKGCDDNLEQYSAYDAKNEQGEFLHDKIDFDKDELVIAGIASEFCVRETVTAFLDAGCKNIVIPADSLGWVDQAGHEKNLADLTSRGVKLI